MGMSKRIADNSQLVYESMRETGTPVTLKNGVPVVVECNMRDVINAMFPQYAVHGNGGLRASQDFHTEISVFLKYSGNARMVRRPNGVTGQLSQWELSLEWIDLEDEAVMDQARAAHNRSNRRSASPLGRVMATAPGQVAPGEDSVTPGCAPVGQVVITEGAPEPITIRNDGQTLTLDPLSAIQAILVENAEAKAEVARLRQLTEELTARVQRAERERNEARMQIRDLVRSWDTE